MLTKPKNPRRNRHRHWITMFVFCIGGFINKSFAQEQSTFNFQTNTFETGSMLRSYAILFDIGKATIRPESFPFLDSMVTFLNTHKNLTLQINRYGDYSPPAYSSRIGQKRATYIRNYLASKGIQKNRLEAKSYGVDKPLIAQNEINKAPTKEAKQKLEQLNRRTEFVILKTDYVDTTIIFRDTLYSIVSDSFAHNMGKVPPVNSSLKKPFRYTGKEPVLITRIWTGDPHFICEYPKEPLVPGKTYWIKICFYQQGRRWMFEKTMGFELSNGENITFKFRGEVLPE